MGSLLAVGKVVVDNKRFEDINSSMGTLDTGCSLVEILSDNTLDSSTLEGSAREGEESSIVLKLSGSAVVLATMAVAAVVNEMLAFSGIISLRSIGLDLVVSLAMGMKPPINSGVDKVFEEVSNAKVDDVV